MELDFVGLAADDMIAADAVDDLVVEAHGRKGTAQFDGTDILHVLGTDNLHDDGRRQMLAFLARLGLAEITRTDPMIYFRSK